MRVFGWIVAGAGIASVSLFLGGIVVGMIRMTPSRVAFLISAIGMLLGVVALIGTPALSFRAGFDTRVAAGLLGMPGALVLIFGLIMSRGAPLINDITTDTANPPHFSHARTLPANQGRDMGFPESFATEIEKGYPELESLRLAGSREEVYDRALAIARAWPEWTVTSTMVTEDHALIEGYATTRVYGFVDDFVIRITDAEEGVVVDMRSKSREGKGDLGANAQRIRAFFDELEG